MEVDNSKNEEELPNPNRNQIGNDNLEVMKSRELIVDLSVIAKAMNHKSPTINRIFFPNK